MPPNNKLTYRILRHNKFLRGEIRLNGSKSISNRVLIIEALANTHFEKKNISGATDTVLMQQLLDNDSDFFDAKDAGTTFRFLTAYLAFKEGSWILTGTERMQQRPVGDLVHALRQLGAEISYLRKENFPPISISGGKLKGGHVKVNADISSQFVSALLMIAPYLPQGLSIELSGKIVSEPYIKMSLALMKYFGVHHEWNKNVITISPQKYEPKEIFIESDWSAASYYYEMAAMSDAAELTLHGLTRDSFQGDAALASFMQYFGVETEFQSEKIILSHSPSSVSRELLFNLNDHPDLAPAMFATAAGLSATASFSGLEHLAYKESNREEALKNELAKCGISIVKSGDIITIKGSFIGNKPLFKTYHDHRMAMALAPLAIISGEVLVEDPMVVSKSYPGYWDDLKKIGFEVIPET